MRIVSFYPDQSGKKLHVLEMKVTDLKMDKEVTDEDFGLDVPAGTIVEDDAGNHFSLKQNQRFYPESIPEITKVAEKRAANPLADTLVPEPSKWYQKGWVYYTAGAIFLLSLAYLVLRRRRTVASS